jgi:hypothetical protein
LVELSDPETIFAARYGIRIARSLIDDLKERLKLTPVANYADPVSAHVVAGRLARESIPCYIGGPPVIGVGPYGIGYSGVPIDDEGKLGLNTLAVPASFVSSAERVLRQQISDAELANLAMAEDPGSRDPP